MEIALETGNRSLVLLLLCNGYDPNLERDCLLTATIRARQWGFVDLLLEWGADPLRVQPHAVCESYDSAVIERFHNLGLDLTADHVLGGVLAEHASNKPLFGFAKRHRPDDRRIQAELNIALTHHAREGNAKGVQLCLWAGADPHARAPDLRWGSIADDDEYDGTTAVYEACSAGHRAILERLKPDPALDDFDELFRVAGNAAVVERLAQHRLPEKMSAVLRSQCLWLEDRGFTRPRSADVIRSLFSVGGRCHEATADEIQAIRRALLKMSNGIFVDVMKLLATGDHCSPDILKSLSGTTAMRSRMKLVGFFPPAPDERFGYDRLRPTRAREVLKKCGITLPKPPRPVSQTITVGSRFGASQIIELDRQGLYEKVWTEPVERLANGWGLSGRGLAKVCARARIPVPPRGYWARLQNGKDVRRRALPAAGDVLQIVICVRRRAPETAS